MNISVEFILLHVTAYLKPASGLIGLWTLFHSPGSEVWAWLSSGSNVGAEERQLAKG